VLWRSVERTSQVAIVHRPSYDDWTLPKGKLEAGEHPLRAAIREVLEETGARARVGRRLESVEYPVNGVPKRVSYWSMHYLSGEHQPSSEVDSIRWLTIAEATHLLSYSVDRAVLADFARLPPDPSMLLLMRHAKAGKRSDYRGDDQQRPLDKLGRRLAREAVPFLAAFGPTRALAADRLRCEQTLQPLADLLGLTIECAPEFSDEAYNLDPKAAVTSLLAVAEHQSASVICSQGEAIPGLIADFGTSRSALPCRKGSVWALSIHRGSLIASDYYPHPDG
jgi:8-oxo-dGTP pyrophosphatase MutT (NUDIX family)/phosphohistidine phosphatase SixA